MRAMFVFLSVFLILAGGCGQTGGGKPQTGVAQPQEAAVSALATLRKLVNEQNFRTMGFESLDEVKNAALGQALPMSQVSLDQLKGYRAGADVNSLLQPGPETIYPVTVNEQVRSSVTVVKADNGYKPSSFGNAEVVKSIARYRQPGESFLLRIPSLNMYYLARRVENRLMLTPIIDDTRLKLQPGVAVPAEEVFNQLSSIANSYNGLPL